MTTRPTVRCVNGLVATDHHLATAAGLDVLRDEPMVEPPAMLAHDNLIVTPHVAASTAEGLRRMGWDSAGNVIDFLAGKVDRDAVVNGEVLGASV